MLGCRVTKTRRWLKYIIKDGGQGWGSPNSKFILPNQSMIFKCGF